jgi:hypothetical protein
MNTLAVVPIFFGAFVGLGIWLVCAVAWAVLKGGARSLIALKPKPLPPTPPHIWSKMATAYRKKFGRELPPSLPPPPPRPIWKREGFLAIAVIWVVCGLVAFALMK